MFETKNKQEAEMEEMREAQREGDGREGGARQSDCNFLRHMNTLELLKVYLFALMAARGAGRVENCTYLYHIDTLAKLKVYVYALLTAPPGGEFSAPDAVIAGDTGLPSASVRSARLDLARDGWLALTPPGRQPGEPHRYTFIVHSEWAEGHPGECLRDEEGGE